MNFSRILQSALVIGRRDFTATVFSRTFIFFLIGPLFPLLIGGVFGTVGASVAGETATPKVTVTASAADFARLAKAEDSLRPLMGERPIELVHAGGGGVSSSGPPAPPPPPTRFLPIPSENPC